MKPTSIIFLVLSIVLIITGFVCCEVAEGMAQSEGISLYSEQTDEKGNRVNTVYYKSSEYDRIEVNITDAKIYLCVGEEEKVVFKNFTEGSYTTTTSGVSYIISDNASAIEMITSGSFNLAFKGLRHYWHDREILSREREVYVYTTSLTELNAIDIVLKKGDVIISDHTAGYDVMADVETGNVTLKKSSAAAFNFTVGSGNVVAEDSTAQRFHADITKGKVTMKNTDVTLLTKIDIDETGDCELDLVGPLGDYVITAYASKSVRINGENMGTDYPKKSEEGSEEGSVEVTGTKTIDINVTGGTVTIKTK